MAENSPGARTRDLGAGFPEERAALVTYLMAGYPDRATSLLSLEAAVEGGADVIELGVPYGDALADGPVIVRAAHDAMRANTGGFGLPESVDLAGELIRGVGVTCPPVVLMTYLNPVLNLGIEETARRAARAGVSGFIIPDMPPDDPTAAHWLEAARENGLATVFLVAPTSTADRVELVAMSASGFVYCVSTTGITGERAMLPSGIEELVRTIKAHTGLPIAVGFGISTAEQAAVLGRIADGVIVGSAIVRREGAPDDVRAFVSSLARAVRDAR